jgi:hypothetical protein
MAGIAGYAFAMALTLTVFGTAPAAAQQAPRFTLPTDASLPVLVMRQRPTELGEAATQEVRVFADGRCSLHRPAVMRGAGEHTWTIAPSEVNDLVSRALDAGIADMNAPVHRANLRGQAAAATAAAGDGHFRFDDDTIEFDIRVDAYRSPGRSQRRDVRRTIEWRGLRTDRSRHPNDVPVRLLSELREKLDVMARTRAPVAPQP